MKNDDNGQRLNPMTMKPVGEDYDDFKTYKEERKKYEKEKQLKHKEKITNFDNTIAKVLKILAWGILGIGLIVFLITGQQIEDNDITILLEICAIYGGISLMILSLSEIIQILHDITLKIYSKK